MRSTRGRAAAVAGATALAVAVAGCGHHAGEPTAWLASARGAAPVHVFGPSAAEPTNNCDDVLGKVAAGPDGTLFVGESTCVKAAGFESRSTKSSGRAPYVLQLLEPTGGVHQLPLPSSTYSRFVEPLAVLSDGSLIAYGGNFQLLAYKPRRGWTPVTAAVLDTRLIGHSGDGGPAAHAKVWNVVAAAAAPDGSVYVAEPYAVRRISRDRTITTIAGTDRFDPPNAEPWTWGGRGRTPDEAYPLRPTATHGKATSIGMPYIMGMTVTNDGTIWLASRDAVYRVRAGQFSLVTTAPRVRAGSDSPPGLHSMTSDGKVVYVCGPGNTGTLYRLDPAHPALTALYDVHCGMLAVTPSGDLLDSAGVHGLYRLPTVQ